MLLDKHEVFKRLYGPNWEVANFDPLMRNIRTGAKNVKTRECTLLHSDTSAHRAADHCDYCHAAKDRSCYIACHYMFCSAGVILSDATVARCCEVLCLRSKGCRHHPFAAGHNEFFRDLEETGFIDESRLVLDIQAEVVEEGTERREENARLVELMEGQAEKLVEGAQDAQDFSQIFDGFKNRKKQENEHRRAVRKTEADLARKATLDAEAQRQKAKKNTKKLSNFFKSKKRMEEQRKAEEQAAQREARAKTEADLFQSNGALRVVRRP